MKQHAHPAPSILRSGPYVQPPEPVRLDPGYDEIRPLSRDDIGELIRAIPAAVVIVAGIGAFFLLMAALTAPVPS